ncbi:MAG: hypothetical protein CM15mP51_06060 [Porticoccaceae bacterium]|nr:MAG: hypothetical protein CM15mP51_06060 [Porticoccaceae bacterium]
MKGAENYLNSNPALKNAELINMVISNELHYVLLSGPFLVKKVRSYTRWNLECLKNIGFVALNL